MNPDVREVLEQAEGKSLVERLAEKYDSVRYDLDARPCAKTARWWLNAIAEELEAEGKLFRPSNPYRHATDWLREQASK